MKAVLISIQPKWCELIASGKKTIEVRKTRPKIDTPFKCYIYCSGGRGKQITSKGNEIGLFRWNGVRLIKQKVDAGWLNDRPKQTWQILVDYGFTHQLHDGDYELNSKVIGEFVCDQIEDISKWEYDYWALLRHINLYAGTDGDYAFLDNYLQGKKQGYGWHISDLKIYDKPKELEWFRKCHKCEYGPLERCKRHEFSCDGTYKIVNPPQSWCYVEELL
jgi:predicted transcriptional regulator|nr:MAG TPA: helix-turn-helix domain-containing protein [Caudoviricetes sp.]